MCLDYENKLDINGDLTKGTMWLDVAGIEAGPRA